MNLLDDSVSALCEGAHISGSDLHAVVQGCLKESGAVLMLWASML